MRARRFNQSSIIERAAYDDDAHSLCISFRQTGKYVYYGVPAAMFDALCKAASVGAFFNEQIKGRFRCRRDPERKRYGPSARPADR
ncbi:KTSC domain-containing protein [Sphingobium xenophagum]|uniref:KTSC domain-containing protein n=1 Tax=Sphingobium xenophagum TaxID=121428 RepID=UPI00209A7BAF|nr:KTSC domain-containing protein [Sphingobium xenophagum]